MDGAADSPSASGGTRGGSPLAGHKRPAPAPAPAPAVQPAAGPGCDPPSSDRTASLALDPMDCGGAWDAGDDSFGDAAALDGPSASQDLGLLGAQAAGGWAVDASAGAGASPLAAAVAAGGSSAFRGAWQAATLQEQALLQVQQQQEQQEQEQLLQQSGSGASALTSAAPGSAAPPAPAPAPRAPRGLAARLKPVQQPNTPHSPPHLMKTSAFR